MAKVIVLRPVLDSIEPATQDSLNRMKEYCVRKKVCEFVPNAWQDLFVTGSTILHKVRADLVNVALTIPGWDCALFVDNDMAFPKDALERLLVEEKAVVGVQYIMRSEPYRVTAWADVDGKPVQMNTPYWREGTHEVAAVGMGLTLIGREVFEKTPQPWFDFGEYPGEDIHFCMKAREAGFKVWLNCDMEIGHVGKHKYTLHSLDRNANSAQAWLEEEMQRIRAAAKEEEEPDELEGEIDIGN